MQLTTTQNLRYCQIEKAIFKLKKTCGLGQKKMPDDAGILYQSFNRINLAEKLLAVL